MLRVGIAVLLGVAGVGCYDPAITPCQLACNEGLCPAGLACNADGLCATTSTDTCAAPGDGASSDEVQVSVRGDDGSPLPGATVVFVDRDGNLAAEVATDADGIASASMAPGGSATVIRTIEGKSVQLLATTFVDLPADARVVSQPRSDRDSVRRVTVHWENPPSAYYFRVLTSCGGEWLSSTMSNTGQVEIPRRCATFDVVVLAHGSSDEILGAVELGAQTDEVIIMPDAWQTPPSWRGDLMNVPVNTGYTEIDLGVSLTPSAPHISRLHPITPTAKGLGKHQVPADATLVTSTRLHLYQASVTPTQLVIARPTSDDEMYTVDLGGKTLPWVETPSMRLDTRTVRWTSTAPEDVTAAEPGFVVATMRYQRSDAQIQWRLIAPASWIAAVGGFDRELVFPYLPDVSSFEPTTVDDPLGAEVNLFAADPDAITSWRMTAEVVMFDDDPFDVPGLTWATISAPPSQGIVSQ